MSACNAIGPEGIRCDMPRHRGFHSRQLDGRVIVMWLGKRIQLNPPSVGAALASLGSTLVAIGAAWRSR